MSRKTERNRDADELLRKVVLRRRLDYAKHPPPHAKPVARPFQGVMPKLGHRNSDEQEETE